MFTGKIILRICSNKNYNFKGDRIMDYNNIPSLDSYVAKYMDENGCSLEQACEELEIDKNKVFNQSRVGDF